MKSLLKFTSRLFSPSAAGLYILLFALAIGVATFIENDFGTSAAQKIVFRSRWFELLLLLFGVSLIANIFRFRLVQQKKWAILTFHLAMIVILLGAGITRYFGQEGMMHIREDGSSDYFLSSETFLQMEVQDRDQKYAVAEPVHFASLGKNSFQQSYLFGGREVRVELENFIPNPQEILVEDEQGVPTLKVVIGGENGREEYFVRSGDRARIRGTL
ncbi:MAG: cytochrome c biogenesis protein ResB, partial [Saprospiraceae bacterium]|nr:cytochrome c biogenesis protein ResB [Saprospiraceae bacterium]